MHKELQVSPHKSGIKISYIQCDTSTKFSGCKCIRADYIFMHNPSRFSPQILVHSIKDYVKIQANKLSVKFGV